VLQKFCAIDRDHEEAVDPYLGPGPGGPVHREALQADDEQDEGLSGVPLPQAAAREQDQRGEDDQARLDADGEVSDRLAPTERSEPSFEQAARSYEEHPEDHEQTRDDDGVQYRVARFDGDERANAMRTAIQAPFRLLAEAILLLPK
jgi:hypothetical protein